jgi:sugar/nucleoside kinase (ribokinase family)
MPLPRLLAIGGAHVDRRGHVTGTYIPGTSNPGVLREEIGGVVFNALRNAVQRGVSGALLSVRGGDAAGEAVARAVAAAGVEDLSATFLDRRTPSYTALLDGDGELIAGLADMELYEVAFPRQAARAKLRAAVAAADAVLCDANTPAAALEKLAAACAGKPLHAIAISPAKAVRLAGLLPRISCLFMNRAEARRLAGAGDDAQPAALAAALRDKGLAAGVITAGSAGATGFDAGGAFSIAAPAARRIADVTGAGDALAGATVAALMRGDRLPAALREGLAAAMLTVEQDSAVVELGAKALAAALALVPQPAMVA